MKNDIQAGEAFDLSYEAKRMPGVYAGRLMSPAEVNGAIGTQPDEVIQKVSSCWTLCGDVSRGMFSALRAASVLCGATERLTAYLSPAGAGYAVLTQQLQGFQHRFLLPLFEPRTASFVAAMSRDSLVYSLGNDDDVEALVWRSTFSARDVLPLQVFCSPLVAESRQEVILEWARVVKTMTALQQVPSTTLGEVVHHVDLTILTPDDTLAACTRGLTGEVV